LRSTEGKTRRVKTGHEFFGPEVGIQNLLTELEEKWLQQFGHVKGVDRTRGTRRASELEFKGETSVGLPRVRQFNKAWETSRREERAGKKLETKDCGKKEGTGDFY
jgi:hypothetical protein